MTSNLRTVQNNVLISEQFPPIRIRIDPLFKYIGGLTFTLNDTTCVEQYHFVQVVGQQITQSLLWIQFEGFLANNQKRYREDHSAERLILGEFEFRYDAGLHNWDDDSQVRPNSDSAQVVAFLRSKGYQLVGDSIFTRLVWLDQEKRNELMIIFSEDLGLSGYQGAESRAPDVAAAQWAAFVRECHGRAMASFSII